MKLLECELNDWEMYGPNYFRREELKYLIGIRENSQHIYVPEFHIWDRFDLDDIRAQFYVQFKNTKYTKSEVKKAMEDIDQFIVKVNKLKAFW